MVDNSKNELVTAVLRSEPVKLQITCMSDPPMLKNFPRGFPEIPNETYRQPHWLFFVFWAN